ncbi:MAG: glycosyltransferase [Bacteroidales bacterium]
MGKIPKKESIEDTMAYKLCKAFSDKGHDITLFAATEYKPINNSLPPFDIIFLKSDFKVLFRPAVLPLHLSLFNKLIRDDFDIIISSEFFSINTLIASSLFRKRCFIWQELSSHNSLFFRIPSRIWYSVIGKVIKSRVIARSELAKDFISKYSSNVLPIVIEHGVSFPDIDVKTKKKDQFIIVARLVRSKNIDSIVYKFAKFYFSNPSYTLIIVGDGELKDELILLCNELGILDSVKFLGFRSHDDLLPIWIESKALLIDTQKDLNMLSVPESIACGTPVIMNEVPLSRHYISKHNLGIVKEGWDADEMQFVVDNNSELVANCLEYRKSLSVSHVVDQFISLYEDTLNK